MLSSKHRKKLIVIVVALLLLIGGVLGATIAYFQDHTGIVKNTFVGGTLFIDPDVDFMLLEKKIEEIPRGESGYETAKYRLTTENLQEGQSFVVLPGTKIPKRPYIKVDRLLMDAYLYVTVDIGSNYFDASNNNRTWTTIDDMIDWSIDENWTYLDQKGTKVIYYYTGSGTKTGGVLPGGSTNMTIDIMKQVGGYSIFVDGSYLGRPDDDGFPTLKFQAYICQVSNENQPLTAQQAWELTFG